HAFLVYSEYGKEELVRNGFERKKIQVYAPIESRNPTAQLSSFSDRNLVLYVGQIIRGKGVDVLLRALSQVRVNFQCMIMGEGSHRSTCESLAKRLNFGDRVRFGGFEGREALQKLYLEASALAVPSVWPEPFGMVGPEAMLYGVPVVAFETGGISEWLKNGENGFLVPWMDAEALAQRLETLLLNKSLGMQMG